MPPGKRQPTPSGPEYADFVPALVAPSPEEAEQYCELLNDHDIPAMIGDENIEVEANEEGEQLHRRRITRGVPVLVPEVMLDEASEIIADRENMEDFQVVEEDVEDEEDDQFGFAEPLEVDLDGALEEDDEEGLFPAGDEDNLEEPDEDEEL